jgi:hypothetical protein
MKFSIIKAQMTMQISPDGPAILGQLLGPAPQKLYMDTQMVFFNVFNA